MGHDGKQTSSTRTWTMLSFSVLIVGRLNGYGALSRLASIRDLVMAVNIISQLAEEQVEARTNCKC